MTMYLKVTLLISMVVFNFTGKSVVYKGKIVDAFKIDDFV